MKRIHFILATILIVGVICVLAICWWIVALATILTDLFKNFPHSPTM